MGAGARRIAAAIGAARGRLRTRTLPTLTAVLLLQISIATGRQGYDLRALSSAFGLLFLLVLALVVATLDAVLIFVASTAGQAMNVRVRFGPLPPVVAPPPPPITDDMLLDKRGRPLRGAPRAARIGAIERERAKLAPAPVAALPSGLRVIELPAWADPREQPAFRRIASAARAATHRAARVAMAAWTIAVAAWMAATPWVSRALGAARVIGARVPLPTLSMRGLRVVAATTTMTFVFATAIGTTGFISRQGNIALGASTTLSIIAGEISVRGSETEPFQSASDGALLRAGMTIRTGPDSYAVLTYFEGSTVSIDPNTTLVIDTLEANPDGSTVIDMTQQIGRTWHSVTKLLHQGSKYQVKTPTATATVRGTAFEVGVETDAAGAIVSKVETTEGAVGTSNAPTPAQPAPAEVLVPAGFQTTVRAAEPPAPPEPAPEPQRTVTVTIGTANAVVLDPVGRANGEKDGKLVLQTPGARVQKVDGKLVVTLPNVPDGKVSTVIAPSAATANAPAAAPSAVDVVTVVAEKGKGEARSTETVNVPAAAPQGAPQPTAAVTGIEVKKPEGDRASELRILAPEENRAAPAPKVADAPKPAQAPEPRQDQAPAPPSTGDRGRSETPAGSTVSNVVAPILTSTLPPLSSEDKARREEEARKAEAKAREDAARREEERRRENDRRAEEARQAEQRAKDEATRITEERRKAEEKVREEVAKSADRAQPAGPTRPGEAAKTDERRTEPTAAPALNLVDSILKAISGPSEDGARKDAEKRAEELRQSEQKAKEEAARLGDERRKAEDQKRQDDVKVAEAARKEAEKRGEQLRLAEQKQKEDAARELARLREIEQKAREQAQQLEESKRREAEKRLEEFRRAEERAREEAAKRIDEQRRAEERAKQEAERQLEELRRAAERAKEEAARADEERRRDREREEQRRRDQAAAPTPGFVPTWTLDPLPANVGRDNSGNSGNSSSGGGNSGNSGNNGRGSGR